MLNLGRLRLLHQLSVLGTISAVAANLNLTRPAVSQQLAQLEGEVGAVLFERSGRGVQLTAAGWRLVARASTLFELVEEIEAEVAASTQAISGEVRLAAFGSPAMSLVPRLFSELAQAHPQLDILFTEMKPADGLRAAATRQVDLAVVDDQVSPDSMAGSLELHPLCVDHYGVAIAAGHPLAGKSSVRLSELAHERWAMGRDGVAHYGFLMSACYASGFTPHVVSKCGNMAARLELVRTGAAVTILPWLALRVLERDPDFRLIPVHPTLTRQIFAVMPRGSSRRPAVATVLRALQRLAKKVTKENKRGTGEGPSVRGSSHDARR